MKRIVITGASRGIGRAIAEKLAEPDCQIFLLGRDQEALVETFMEVESKGGKPEIITGDLTEPENIQAIVDKLGSDPIDVLVNNAGIAVVKPFAEVTLDEWQEQIDINLTAPFLLTQKLLPKLEGTGNIVNILSVASKVAFPGWSSYCATKFGFDGLMRAAREEFRSRGIRVINIYPGSTDTEIWEDVPGDWPTDQMMAADEIADAVAFTLSRPHQVVVEDVTIGGLGGNL